MESLRFGLTKESQQSGICYPSRCSKVYFVILEQDLLSTRENLFISMPLETLQFFDSALSFELIENNSVLVEAKLFGFLIMSLSSSQKFFNRSQHHSHHHITFRFERIYQNVEYANFNEVFDVSKVCSDKQISKTVSKFNLSFQWHVAEIQRNDLILVYLVQN